MRWTPDSVGLLRLAPRVGFVLIFALELTESAMLEPVPVSEVWMDFTELMPIGGIHAPNFLVAKLIFLTLGYAYHLPKK